MDEQRENLQPEQNEAAAQDAKRTERGWESLAFLHDMVYLLAIVTILFTFFFRLVAARNRAVRREFVFSYAGQNHLFKFATFRLMYCDKRYLFKLFAYHVHLASR